MDEFEIRRERMVTEQIQRRGITNRALLQALRAVPRHAFVPPEMRESAYDDSPLPIGNGQTISQPFIVAYMTSLLDLKGHEVVLEVGTGSGYQAAVLSLLAHQVHTTELIPQLAARSAETLRDLGYDNVVVHQSDGSLGWPPCAPYDAILVTASAPRLPAPLLEQLSPQGRLVLPVGGRGVQWLELWQQENGLWQPEQMLPVAFVPLRGAHGWRTWED
jgi:protein-L-isoaspartate(D-aspartate) O-methyltransferase